LGRKKISLLETVLGDAARTIPPQMLADFIVLKNRLGERSVAALLAADRDDHHDGDTIAFMTALIEKLKAVR
jgi:hypothetical protein